MKFDIVVSGIPASNPFGMAFDELEATLGVVFDQTSFDMLNFAPTDKRVLQKKSGGKRTTDLWMKSTVAAAELSVGVDLDALTVLLLSDFDARARLERALEGCQKLFGSIESLTCGVGAEIVKRFYADHPDMPQPHSSFGGAHNWFLRRPKATWSRFYTASSLSNAPFESVRFTADDHLEITFFADPFSFESPDTQQRILEIAHYLDQHRIDRVLA